MKQLKLEFIKNRIPILIILTFFFLAINFIWCSYGLRTSSDSQRQWGWMILLYQMPILNAILAPSFVAVIASRIADVEHKGEVLKLLYTLQSRSSLYHAKLSIGLLFCFLLSLGQMVVTIFTGVVFHFEHAVPLDKMSLYFFFSFLVTFASYILQLNLSLFIHNQMVSLCIGITGSFCGLFLMFLYQYPILQHVVLWTNYVTLTLCIMSDYDEKTRYIAYTWRTVNYWGLLAITIWTVLLYIVGRRLLAKEEV